MFKNWSKSSYIIGALGALVITIATLITSPLTGNLVKDSYEIANIIFGLFGFLSVILIVNRKKQSGLIGMVSAVGFIMISIVSRNYADSILSVFFILALNLPIMLNKDWQDEEKEPTPIKGNWKKIIILIVLAIVVFGVLYFLDTHVLMSPRPILDSLAATLGITAGVMTAFMRAPEAFYVWSLQNIFQLILYFVSYIQGDASITLALTYLFYTLNASTSFFNGKWFGTSAKLPEPTTTVTTTTEIK